MSQDTAHYCRGCRIPKMMYPSRAICGCFAWPLYMCVTCHEVLFTARWARWGFLATKLFFNGTIMVERSVVEVCDGTEA